MSKMKKRIDPRPQECGYENPTHTRIYKARTSKMKNDLKVISFSAKNWTDLDLFSEIEHEP